MPRQVDLNDASLRWTRLRYTAEDAARLLAGLRDLGVSRDTLFDAVGGTLDALADAAAVNERESDERGVLQDWQGFGDACEALAEWRHWVLQNRPRPVTDMVQVARQALGIPMAAE